MKNIVFIVLLVCFSVSAFSAEDVSGQTVSYVYQPDLAPTEFDFDVGKTHGCGSTMYRVKSNDETTANRKFSLILAAFSSGKKVSFHDSGVCSGNRSIVTWVRITN